MGEKSLWDNDAAIVLTSFSSAANDVTNIAYDIL